MKKVRHRFIFFAFFEIVGSLVLLVCCLSTEPQHAWFRNLLRDAPRMLSHALKSINQFLQMAAANVGSIVVMNGDPSSNNTVAGIITERGTPHDSQHIWASFSCPGECIFPNYINFSWISHNCIKFLWMYCVRYVVCSTSSVVTTTL